MSNLLLRFTGTRALGLLVAGGSALLGSLATGCAGNSDGPDGGSCVPTVTCASAAYDCGQALDNCGNVIECGSCGAGETCGAAGPNVCGVGTCTPATCASLGLTCGPMADGCGTAWSCGDECASGDGAGTGGGSPGTGGAAATGGAPATGGASGTISPLGEGVFSGSGTANNTNDGSGRYAKGTVIRDAQWYRFLVNGWGDWGSSTASWLGTSFTVSMAGSTNGAGVPVGYPCMYCGNYADETGQTKCGLPIEIATATQVRTGWIWDANGNTGQYNAAWDIWIGDGTTLQSYLMVWLRDPPGQTPAGGKTGSTTIANQNWDIWTGSVGPHPIVNYVRPEGQDLNEFEFDVLDFYNDAKNKGLVGTHINSVAVGFEVWNSVTNVKTVDFYVDPK